MAHNLAKKGLDVLLTYHTNKEAADTVISEVEALGGKAWALQLDTSKAETFDAFVEEATQLMEEKRGSSKIDFLINNAGTGLYVGIPEVTEAQMNDLYEIHFKGPFFLTQKMLPHLNDGGGILNISSGLTRITMPGSSVYASMKTAVETLSRYQAKELGPRRIRVNTLAPGAIETDFGGGRTRDNKEINSTIAGFTALGRVGLPTDIGSVVAFLCTDEAGWINGQRLEVSGGQAI